MLSGGKLGTETVAFGTVLSSSDLLVTPILSLPISSYPGISRRFG